MRRMQELVGRWTRLVFVGHEKKVNPLVRYLRLYEEIVELGQAMGIPQDMLDTVRDQVFSREAGEPGAELGGVMITLMGFCDTCGFDAEEAFWNEFERIMDPAIMMKVRNRNLRGDKIGME